MKKNILLLLMFCCSFSIMAQNKYVMIKTDFGKMVVKLYDETPLHSDNFMKLTKQGFYDSLLFHRVIKNFMIQGGDPSSKRTSAAQALGEGDVDYTIPAEFNPELFHVKGALAAARDNNPEKASSGCQFYLVQGKVFTDDELNALEKNRLGGRKIPEKQREIYKTIGGTPHLDQNYTVFGIVVKGIEVIDKIAEQPTNKQDRPVQDIRMKVKRLNFLQRLFL